MTYGVSKTKSTSGHDSRPFALQQNNIDKHITNRLHYFKNLQKQLDAQATKASSIALRKQWLDKQKKLTINLNMTALEVKLNIIMLKVYQ